MILGVFTQITFSTSGRNPIFDLGHLDILQFLDFGFNFVVTGPCHGDTIGHGHTSSRNFKTRVSGCLSPAARLLKNLMPPETTMHLKKAPKKKKWPHWGGHPSSLFLSGTVAM
jgi:hypothetical protein